MVVGFVKRFDHCQSSLFTIKFDIGEVFNLGLRKLIEGVGSKACGGIGRFEDCGDLRFVHAGVDICVPFTAKLLTVNIHIMPNLDIVLADLFHPSEIKLFLNEEELAGFNISARNLPNVDICII